LGPERGNEKGAAPNGREWRSDGRKQWSFRRLSRDEARLRKRQSKDEVADGLRLLRDALSEHVVDDADAHPVLDIIMRSVVPWEYLADVFCMNLADIDCRSIAEGVRRALHCVQRDSLGIEPDQKRHSAFYATRRRIRPMRMPPPSAARTTSTITPPTAALCFEGFECWAGTELKGATDGGATKAVDVTGALVSIGLTTVGAAGTGAEAVASGTVTGGTLGGGPTFTEDTWEL
jgi:hypothetical protein